MKSSPIQKTKPAPKAEGATLSTRINSDLYARVTAAADKVGVGHAELVREGLARCLAEIAKTGSIRFGRPKKSA